MRDAFKARVAEHHAAGERLLFNAREIHGAAMARRHALHGGAVLLQAAHPRQLSAGQKPHAVVAAHAPGGHRARHHRPEAGHGEGAVYGQAEVAAGVSRREFPELFRQRAAKFVEPLTGVRRHRHDGCCAQKRRHVRERADFIRHRLHACRRDKINFVKRDHAGFDAEQGNDLEMLARLRHHAVVGRDHQQHQVHAARARHHVVHEALVTGHVNDAHAPHALHVEVREAEINGHAAALFLRQPVGVHAGQAVDERGLAVVNVSGGADDHGRFSNKRTGNSRISLRGRSSSARTRPCRSRRGRSAP